MKKYTYFLVVIVLVACSCESANNKRTDISPLDIAMNISKSFVSHTEDSATDFPDYYSGMYINDKDVLIVLVTDSSQKNIGDLKLRAGVDNFIIEECKFSLNELKKLKDELSIKFRNEKLREELGWVSVGIVLVDNKVEVRLSNCSSQYIEQFMSVISDSPMIQFVQMSPIEITPSYIDEEDTK